MTALRSPAQDIAWGVLCHLSSVVAGRIGLVLSSLVLLPGGCWVPSAGCRVPVALRHHGDHRWRP